MLQVQNHILGTTVLQNSEQSHQSEVGNFPPPPFAQPRPLRTGAPLPTKLLLLEGSMQHALGISPFTPPPPYPLPPDTQAELGKHVYKSISLPQG